MRSKSVAVVGALLFLGVGVAAGTWFSFQGDDDVSALPYYVQPAGELMVEEPDQLGPDPFSATPLSPTPVGFTTATIPTGTSDAVQTEDGSKPGLYGGSNQIDICDPQDIVDFLAANPDKATAFVTGVNADPNLYYENGPLTVDKIGDYFSTLTPVVLTKNTWVTNNGYFDGSPTPRQSLLKAGTAVLVDKTGTPRVKCYCGNPLSPPKPPPEPPKLVCPPGVDCEPNVPVSLIVVSCEGPDCPPITTVPLEDCAAFAPGTGPATCTDEPPAESTTTTAPDTGESTTTDTTVATTDTTVATTETSTETTAPVGSPPVTQCTPTDDVPQVVQEFENLSAQPLTVVWHSFECALVFQFTLAPGETAPLDTFPGHIFSVVDDAGNEVDTFAIPDGGGTWTWR